ncbi:MAG: hypothetical protein EPO32_00170 [Anaerolineae bacterium]|nr:MAG: hypothetical protein EPO32_00170 [Anaerolineae bacterium]
MQASLRQPPFEQMSILIATALLNFSLAQFVTLPELFLPIQFLGVFVPLRLTTNSLIAATSAGLIATGADWLIRRHPSAPKGSTLPNLVLPAFTAWILSFPLNNLDPGPTWWLALAGSGLALLVVLSAEYASLDSLDTRSSFANAVLASVAYAVFFILAVTLQSLNARLLFLVPTIGLAAALVHLRITQIQFGGWRWLESSAAGLLAISLAAPLHYLHISPVAFGVLVLAALYAFTVFNTNLLVGRSWRRAFLEPLLALALGLVVAVIA